MRTKQQKICSDKLVMPVCVLIFTLILVSPLSAKSAQAQGYPTSPIEVVHGFNPGTANDIMARLIAELAPKYLGQPMIVINKPGASSIVAAADVIASKPDGYKLFTGVHHMFASTIHTMKIPFDAGDLVPLANYSALDQGMGVRGDSPFKTFSDLLEYARKNPGQLKWSHSGRGITPQLTALLIFKKEGIESIDVPYKSVVEAMTALLGGHVDMASVTGPYSEHVKAGKMRLLMVYADRRSTMFPNVPTAAELGYPNVFLPAYTGIYCHKKTPEHIKKILIDALKKIYDDPAFQKGVETADVQLRWGGPDFINEQIKRSEAIVVPALKELGMYIGK